MSHQPFTVATLQTLGLGMTRRVQAEVVALLRKAVEECVPGWQPPEGWQTVLSLDAPAHSAHGEFSTNIAMRLPKLLKDLPNTENSTPHHLAQAIAAAALRYCDPTHIANVEVAGPGFINIRLQGEYLAQTVLQPAQDTTQDRSLPEHDRIVVEFTDPNPFKEFHIGHLYSNTVGEALSRLLAAQGNQVHRVNYQGDVGLHVAKSIWGMVQALQPDPVRQLTTLEQQPLEERVRFLGQSYARGAQAFENESDPDSLRQVKQDITAINLITFVSAQQHLEATTGWVPQVDYRALIPPHSLDESLIAQLYQAGRTWSLEMFETIYQRLGTQFTDYFFESVVAEYGMQIVKEYLAKGVFENSQGAVIFPGKKYGLHDRVFINSLGLPTYEAKELGLAPEKARRWPYDRSFIITANEINEYFKVLLCALQQVRPDLAAKTRHLSHGVVRLPEGKMSSRTGNILTGTWLIDEAKQRLEHIITANHPDWSEGERDTVAEQVAVGAIKYALLKGALGRDIAFQFETSLSFEGNSGPYLQYTAARADAVLKKSTKTDEVIVHEGSAALSQITTESDRSTEHLLERTLLRFDQHVHRAITDLSPHHVCTGLYEVAQAFNGFYASQPILSGDAEQPRRLLLTLRVRDTLRMGLNLLGMPAPERM